MQIQQQSIPSSENKPNNLYLQFSNGKLSQLAQSTHSQQFQNCSLKSDNSIQSLCEQKIQRIDKQIQGDKQEVSTQNDDFSLEQITLKNIKSKQEIEIQSKENQTIMLNLNFNIDDLFKKISSLTDEISTQLKSQTRSSQLLLKQKNLDFQNNILHNKTQKQDNKTKSTPQISFKQHQKQYKPIFFQPLPSEPKCYGINMKLFQIGKSLGYGKFGQVVQCRNKKTNYLYALKKIFKSIIQEYKMQQQLLTQLKILSLIDHPNIVKSYQSFTDSYHIFILMQYVQGISLTKKFKSPELQLKSIIRQVLLALQYLHKNNICHRDLKPQNIILTDGGVIKLCDFGWASYGENQMDILCGTLDYVSYEMVNEIKYTKNVDLWSVGVLTYELVYGYAPFKDTSKSRTFENVKKLSYTFDQQIEISQQCKNFIEKLLKPQTERMTIQEALNHQFLSSTQINQINEQQFQNDFRNEFEQILSNESI